MTRYPSDDGPHLKDITYSDDLLSQSNFEVILLDDQEFRCLMRLVAFSAAARCWTYTEPDPEGKIGCEERGMARLAGVSLRAWRRIRPKLEPFFRITPAGWILDRDWVNVNGAQNLRPAVPAGLRSFVMQRDNYRCGYCGTADGPFHLDHIVPVSKGGATDADNLICACSPCNLDKKAKDADEWIAERGSNVVALKAVRGPND